MAHCHRLDVDLITNVYPRTFPKGQSVEMLRAETFAAIPADLLTAEEQEHMTKYYYNNPDRFRILNLDSGNAELGQISFVIDTIEDLRRLEEMATDTTCRGKLFEKIGMNSDKKIGVAVIGLGVGEQHARAYLATPGCEVRWLYDLDQDKAKALRELLGVG